MLLIRKFYHHTKINEISNAFYHANHQCLNKTIIRLTHDFLKRNWERENQTKTNKSK